MRILTCVLLALLGLGPALAQARPWEGVDWRSVTVYTVQRILEAGGGGTWDQLVLSPAADPDRHLPPDEAKPLLLALCYSRDPEVIRTLLAAGAPAGDTGPASPLMYAAQYNTNPAIIEALLDDGAQVGANLGYTFLGRPALSYAAQYSSSPEVIGVLVARGAAVNAKVSVLDNMGTSPLMYAAQYNRNPEIVEELLRDGALLDLPDSMGRTSLVFAAQYNPNPRVLAALLAAGAAVNIVGRDYYNVGFTPLMYAAVSEEAPEEKLGLLLDAGADPEARSREGKRAYDYAAANPALPGSSPVLQRLKGIGR